MVVWGRISNSEAYRRGSIAERRLLELRVSVGMTLRALRRRLGVTQAELARRIGSAQPTISRIERASEKVSLELAVRALLALEASDAIIAIAFDAANSRAVQKMRERSDLPYFTRPHGQPRRDPVLAIATGDVTTLTRNQHFPDSRRSYNQQG